MYRVSLTDQSCRAKYPEPFQAGHSSHQRPAGARLHPSWTSARHRPSAHSRVFALRHGRPLKRWPSAGTSNRHRRGTRSDSPLKLSHPVFRIPPWPRRDARTSQIRSPTACTRCHITRGQRLVQLRDRRPQLGDQPPQLRHHRRQIPLRHGRVLTYLALSVVNTHTPRDPPRYRITAQVARSAALLGDGTTAASPGRSICH